MIRLGSPLHVGSPAIGLAVRIGTVVVKPPEIILTEEQRWQAAFPDPNLLAWTTLARSLEGATP